LPPAATPAAKTPAPTFSPFRFLVFGKDEESSWETLPECAWPYLDSDGLGRLRSALSPCAKSVVVERFYIDKDYRNTFSDFHSKRFATPDSRCIRLHFFSAPVREDKDVGQNASAYLGYSVIRPTKPNCIGRTMLTHKIRARQNAHLSICRERVNLLGNPLEVEGFPFISQDGDATVCAESALWMLLRYHSNRYSSYSEIHPSQITNLAAQYAHGSRVYPSGGLAGWQFAEMLRLSGFSPLHYSREQCPDKFEHLLYTYVESGLPLLAIVERQAKAQAGRHVVVVFGHVSDYAWGANARPLCGAFYSSAFNQEFVINQSDPGTS
jgi:hypothetical protein